MVTARLLTNCSNIYATYILTPEIISQGYVQNGRRATFSWPILYLYKNHGCSKTSDCSSEEETAGTLVIRIILLQVADTAHCLLLKVAARVQCTFLIAWRYVVRFPPVLFLPAVHVTRWNLSTFLLPSLRVAPCSVRFWRHS